MDKQQTINIVSFYLIVAFYEEMLNGGKITRAQYEKACCSLAEEMHCTVCVF